MNRMRLFLRNRSNFHENMLMENGQWELGT